MPEALPTLQQLQRKEITLGIVSNAQFNTPLMFPALLGHNHISLGFDGALCTWSYKSGEVKPSRSIFQRIVERLEYDYGIPPDKAMYVGNDMLNDVWAASQCGLKTALFAGDQRSLQLRKDHPECVNLKPNIIITKLPQLLEIFV